MILDMEDFKERRRQKAFAENCEDIEVSLSLFEEMLDLINTLPEVYIVRAVKYALKHRITFQDLTRKEE
jgi:hypothetical protein